MYRKRIIPVLLYNNEAIEKSIRFKSPVYLGDPINAVHIYNMLKADEIILLDIFASEQNRTISVEYISEVTDECLMPLAVGGGIKTTESVSKLLSAGAEKVIINSAAIGNEKWIQELASEFGSQAIVCAIDYKEEDVYINRGKTKTSFKVLDLAQRYAEAGAGEIFLQSVDRDGTRAGFDLPFIGKISSALNIPLIACGGAGKTSDITNLFSETEASAAACGSLFSLYGELNAALISYPSRSEIEKIYSEVE